MAKGYTFLCANSTYKECIDRMLFGGKEVYKKEIPEIKPGDKVFLFNYQESLLYGVFTAVSKAEMNIQADAWKGGFPWQVKVDYIKKHQPLSTADLMGVFAFRRKKYPPARLTSEQVEKLESLFNSEKRLPFFRNIIPYTTDDGHRVRSQGEQQIDNWLYKNGILHAYEKQLISINGIMETMYCDFHIPIVDTYIEYWGLTDEEYKKRSEKKKMFYESNNLNLIEIYPKDLDSLDLIFASLFS